MKAFGLNLVSVGVLFSVSVAGFFCLVGFILSLLLDSIALHDCGVL